MSLLDKALAIFEVAGGAFGGGWANDAYISPFVEKQFPQLAADHTASKVVDTATTLGTGMGLGYVGRKLGLGMIADRLEYGTSIYAALKAFTILVPGAEAKLTVPNPLSLFRAQQAMAPGPGAKALPGGGAAPLMLAGGAGGTTATLTPGSQNIGSIPSNYIVSGVGTQASSNLSVGF